MSFRTVDLSKLVGYTPPGPFVCIPTHLESIVSAYPEIHERLNGCLEFCRLMGLSRNTLESVNDKRKYLRAALAELVSLEEAAAIDLHQYQKCSGFKILDFDDPRMCM